MLTSRSACVHAPFIDIFCWCCRSMVTISTQKPTGEMVHTTMLRRAAKPAESPAATAHQSQPRTEAFLEPEARSALPQSANTPGTPSLTNFQPLGASSLHPPSPSLVARDQPSRNDRFRAPSPPSIAQLNSRPMEALQKKHDENGEADPYKVYSWLHCMSC